MSTPSQMNLKHPKRIAPAGGWKPQTYYVCEVAFSADNVIHKAIFYTGFLNGRNGEPEGYNGFVEGSGYEDGAPKYRDAYYVRPIIELLDRKMSVIGITVPEIVIDGDGQ